VNPLGWIPVGPSVMYNGQLTGSGSAPVSGRCTCIAVHPTDPKTVYVGTATGGVWKTTDSGNIWKAIMDDQINLSIGAMAFDPKNPDRLYVATGEGNAGGEILAGGGLLIYTAAPIEGWELRNYNDLVGRRIRNMVINDATTPYTIWLATDNYALESLNDGSSFTQLQFVNPEPPGHLASPNVSDIAFNKVDNILFVAVWGDGIYKRAGGTFSKIPRGPGNLPGGNGLGRIAIGMCKNHPESLYSSFGNSTGGFAGIYFSPDKGVNWPACNLPSPVKNLGQSHYNHYLVVDPDTPTTVFFGELKVWRSTDGGKNWSRSSDSHGDSPGIHSDQHCLTISSSDKTQVWAGNDGGVWYSFDSGVSFFSRNRGLQTMQYYSLAQHPDDASILLAGAQDNGSQRFEGHPAWDLTTYGDGFFSAIDPAEPFRWYAAYVFLQDGDIKCIQRSEKAGKLGSWDYVVDGIKNTFDKDTEPFYVPFVIDPTDHHVLYLGTNQLYRSDHFGDNWRAVYTDPATKTPWTTSADPAKKNTSAVTITAIAANPWDGTHVYVGTADGNVFSLVRQGDGSFKVTPLAGLPAGGYISDICVAPPIAPATTSYVIYVGLGSPELSGVSVQPIAQGRIFSRNVLTDPNWTPLKGPGLDRTLSTVTLQHVSNPVNAIAVDPDNPRTIYIGCDSGVFRSTDQGANWSLFSDNLTNAPIADLQFHRKGKLLRAATMGRSIWEISTDAAPGSPPATIVYIRRNILDLGRDPVPADAVDPLDKDSHINPFSGADIKIDTPLFLGFETPASREIYGDDKSPADYVAFPQLDTSNVFRRNKKSRVYAEVMNRGPADATNVIVRAFYASKDSGKYPKLPADFWTAFPNSDPADLTVWKKCGDKVTLGTIRPGQPKVAMWELDEIPFDTKDPLGVLAVVTSTEDGVGITDLDPNVAALTARHLALREASVNMSTAEVVLLILVAVGLAGLATYGIVSAVKK